MQLYHILGLEDVFLHLKKVRCVDSKAQGLRGGRIPEDLRNFFYEILRVDAAVRIFEGEEQIAAGVESHFLVDVQFVEGTLLILKPLGWVEHAAKVLPDVDERLRTMIPSLVGILRASGYVGGMRFFICSISSYHF